MILCLSFYNTSFHLLVKSGKMTNVISCQCELKEAVENVCSKKTLCTQNKKNLLKWRMSTKRRRVNRNTVARIIRRFISVKIINYSHLEKTETFILFIIFQRLVPVCKTSSSLCRILFSVRFSIRTN